MHTIIKPRKGWKVESLSDDGDKTLDEELKGCVFYKEVKENKTYAAEIRYEEQTHNQLVFVEAVVFKENGDLLGENTLTDVKFFKRKGFEGDDCKTKAAKYASELETEIDSLHFSE